MTTIDNAHLGRLVSDLLVRAHDMRRARERLMQLLSLNDVVEDSGGYSVPVPVPLPTHEQEHA